MRACSGPLLTVLTKAQTHCALRSSDSATSGSCHRCTASAVREAATGAARPPLAMRRARDHRSAAQPTGSVRMRVTTPLAPSTSPT